MSTGTEVRTTEATDGDYVGFWYEASCNACVFCFSRKGKQSIDAILEDVRKATGKNFECIQASEDNTVVCIPEDFLSYDQGLQILERNPSLIKGVRCRPMNELHCKAAQ